MTQDEYYLKYPKLKTAHEEGFNGLLEFKNFCEKHDIEYSLFYGTLLGAARHQTFIPWDDDIDTIMTRDNYEKFLELSNKYSQNYIISNERTYPDRGIFTTRIIFKNSKLKEKTTQKFEYPTGVWVDVFVLDEVPRSNIRRNIHKFWCYVWDTWTYRKAKHNYSKLIYKILHHMLIWPAYLFSFKWMLRHMDKITRKYNGKNTGLLSNTNCRGGYVKPLKKEWTKEYVYLEFNNEKFKVFKEWKEMLNYQYGDWQKMPPKNERKPLHYK